MATGAALNRKNETLSDQIGREQVERIIHHFYQKLRNDPEIQHFFSHIEDFSSHESHIADFWWIALGGKLDHKPAFDMLNRHRALSLNEQAFNLWLETFEATLHEELPLASANQWYQLAVAIGENLRRYTIGGEQPGLMNISLGK